jgi:hypothetical protein
LSEAARKGFVLPTLVLTAAAVLYTQVALGPALPRVLPPLVEQSVETESELARAFRWMVLVLALTLPSVFVLLTSLGAWVLLRVARAGRSFRDAVAVGARASLWVAAGLVAKAGLVMATGEPEPPTNLSLLLDRPAGAARIALAFTNPFFLLAAVTAARGLRRLEVPHFPAWAAGAGPWLAWTAFFVLGAGGTEGRLAAAGPISYEGWETITKETVVVRHPPGMRREAAELATILDGFTKKLAEQFDFEPRVVHVHVFRNHDELVHAAGERLHVKVTGSIRGRELLFLEMPGRSAAMPKVDGIHEAIRWTALMHLPFVPGIEGSPRWFIEGLAHAAAMPLTPRLDQEYRAMLRRDGVPSFERLLDDRVFVTPEGPLLARSVVDHIVFVHGREALSAVRADVAGGATFRDALFARTRLTTSELEAGWQDSIREVLRREGVAGRAGAAADTGAVPDTADVEPFLERR